MGVIIYNFMSNMKKHSQIDQKRNKLKGFIHLKRDILIKNSIFAPQFNLFL